MSSPGASTESPQISVIVPVYNGGERIVALLDALQSQTVPAGTFEVLVVDDRSTDGTAAAIDAHPVATLLRAPERRGSYAARNRALAVARGRVMAFTDGDCIPVPEWIEAGLRALETTGADMVAGHIEVPVRGRPTVAAMLDASRFLDQERYVHENFGATANLWVRAEVFDTVGGFNEKLISGGDTEFCHRATAAGVSLAYSPDMVVVHEARTRRMELGRKAFRLGVGAAQHNYHAEGPLRDRDRIWRHPGAYLPKGSLRGLERLRAQGIEPSRRQLFAMHCTQYLFIKLPNAFGNLSGSVREERAARRAPASSPSAAEAGDPVGR